MGPHRLHWFVSAVQPAPEPPLASFIETMSFLAICLGIGVVLIALVPVRNRFRYLHDSWLTRRSRVPSAETASTVPEKAAPVDASSGATTPRREIDSFDLDVFTQSFGAERELTP